MDSMLTFLLGVLLIVAIVVLGLRSALAGSVPVKGKTNIPGPTWGYTLPLIGDAWRFARVRNMKDLMAVYESLGEQKDKATKIWLGSKLMVFVRDPKMGEAILNSTKAAIKDPDVYNHFNHIADGVFSRNGKSWSALRRPLDKMMTPQTIMGKYFSVFVSKSEALCEALNSMCGKGMFEIRHYIEHCLSGMVFGTLLGLPGEFDALDFFDLTNVDKTVSICLRLAINPLYKFPWLLKLSALYREMKAVQSSILPGAKRLTATRMNFLEESGQNPNDADFEPECYTDVVMKVTKNEGLEDDYRGHTMGLDLAVAAYDTNAVTISTAILFLAMHPDYQEKAFQEQFDIMGNSLLAPTQTDIAKMDYLWMVIQETMRHIGVPGVFRLISSELIIDDYVFPAGTSAYVSIHNFNMTPEYWVKTKEFYPDNFLPEYVAKRPKAAFLPFSSGARVCPGKTYAHVTAKIILSLLLRKYKFSTNLKYSDMDYKYMLMIESTRGYPVAIERRAVADI